MERGGAEGKREAWWQGVKQAFFERDDAFSCIEGGSAVPVAAKTFGGFATTPWTGWCCWRYVGCDVAEELGTAGATFESGMKDADRLRDSLVPAAADTTAEPFFVTVPGHDVFTDRLYDHALR